MFTHKYEYTIKWIASPMARNDEKKRRPVSRTSLYHKFNSTYFFAAGFLAAVAFFAGAFFAAGFLAGLAAALALITA